jgi:hypothetical protein
LPVFLNEIRFSDNVPTGTPLRAVAVDGVRCIAAAPPTSGGKLRYGIKNVYTLEAAAPMVSRATSASSVASSSAYFYLPKNPSKEASVAVLANNKEYIKFHARTLNSEMLQAMLASSPVRIEITQKPKTKIPLYRLGGGKNSPRKVRAKIIYSGGEVAGAGVVFKAAGRAVSLKNKASGRATATPNKKGSAKIIASFKDPLTGKVFAASFKQKVFSEQKIVLSAKKITMRENKKMIVITKVYDNGKRVRPRLKVSRSRTGYAAAEVNGQALILSAKRRTTSALPLTVYPSQLKSLKASLSLRVTPGLTPSEGEAYYSYNGRPYWSGGSGSRK